MKRMLGIVGPLLAWAFVSATAHAAAPDDFNKPIAPFKIIGNLYYVGTDGLAAFLVTTPQGHVLVNAGRTESAPLIEASIAKLGFKVSDVKYLLVGRANRDQAGGLARLKQDTGAQIIAGAGDKPLLEGGLAGQGVAPVKVDRAVGDNDKLTLVSDKITKGGVLFVAHLTPGPTPGCTSWTLPVREQRWNHTVMFLCGPLDGKDERLVGSGARPGIVDDYQKTLGTARFLIADVFVAPYPAMFAMKDKLSRVHEGWANPFIKGGEYHAYLDAAQKTFKAELEQQQQAVSADAAASTPAKK